MIRIACVLLFAAGVVAGPPRVEWAIRAGGPKHDKTRGICVDEAGNVYMTGEFTGTADFGPRKMTSRGALDYFVAKYDAAGNCLWVKQGGGAKTDRGYGVAVDHDGNVYTTGHYESDDADFDGQKPSLTGGYDVFVAKYNRDGVVQWVRHGGGAGYDYGHGIAVDAGGNVYVGAAVAGESKFENLTFNYPGKSNHAIIASYFPDGRLRWLTPFLGKGGSSCGSITADAAGNCWISGGYSGEQALGELTPLNSAGGRGIFVAKLDANGKAQWVYGTDGKADGGASSVGVDGSGRCYIAGMFKGTATIGSDSFRSVDENDIFVAALDEKGKPLWARHAGGKGIDYALALCADPAGGCYIGGEVSTTASFPEGQSITSGGGRDIYAAHFSADGKLLDLYHGGGEKNDLCYCVSLHAATNTLYLSGAFDGVTKYGDTALTSAGSNDIVLIKLKR